MRIFISWSGERSQALALALKDWIPLVLHYADPWFSTSDIKSGDRWNLEVSKGLQESKFGIICLTRDNLEAPWLLFEAGALAKSMEDGRVIPLRLDIETSDITGPLAQFQSEKADEGGIRRLVTTLNGISASPVSDDRVAQLFSLAWERIKDSIEAIPASSSAQKKSRPTADILEELVSGVRSVEIRVREMSDEDFGPRRRMRRRIDPMFMDMMMDGGSSSGDPIQILMLASAFREDLPWLYELATDVYRDMNSGDLTQARKSFDRFKQAILNLRRGPFLEMIGRKEMHMLVMEAPHFLERIERQQLPPKNRRARIKPTISREAETE
jgi:hypothetical protein